MGWNLSRLDGLKFSRYLERRLNTYWTSEHDKARHSEAAHQPQSFSTNSRVSISNYIRLIAHGYSFSTVGDLFVALELLANKTFNHVVRMLVARLYDVYVRLPLSEKKWKLELRGFIEKLWIPMHWGFGWLSCLMYLHAKTILQPQKTLLND